MWAFACSAQARTPWELGLTGQTGQPCSDVSEGPQHLEETLRDCKAQAPLLLPTVQEQYFSTPVTGLLTTRLSSDVYMGFCRQIRAYSGCWPREPEAMELQLMCYMPKLLWPAERQDISLSSGLWPAQTISEISFPLCAERHGDKDRQLV